MNRQPINPRVMIDDLYEEGVRWAGWYRPENLRAKHDQVFGRYMQGSFPRVERWEPETWDVDGIDWSQLDRWLEGGMGNG